jgi:heme exporter protein D
MMAAWIDLGPHGAFILASYLACATILCALGGWIILDNRARKRELGALEAHRSPDQRR